MSPVTVKNIILEVVLALLVNINSWSDRVYYESFAQDVIEL